MSRNGAVYWPIKNSLEVCDAATCTRRAAFREGARPLPGAASGTVRLNQFVERDHGKFGAVRQAQETGVVMQA